MSEETAVWDGHEITTQIGTLVGLYPNALDRNGAPVHGVRLVNEAGVETAIGLSDSAIEALCTLWLDHKRRIAPRALRYTPATSTRGSMAREESV